MCLECKGWSREQVLAEHRRLIDEHGWSLTTVSRRCDGPADFSYTAGLTRLEGHPELLVSGLPVGIASQLLNSVAADVQNGTRLRPGDEIHSSGAALALLRAVRVSDPRRLVIAQEVYASALGPVPALQLVWANGRGAFPGQSGWCPDHDGPQELFGRVPRPRRGH